MRKCKNVLKIDGPADEIKRFKELARDISESDKQRFETALSFDNFFPIPEEFSCGFDASPEKFAYLKEKYGASNYREWCIENWGTNCDVITDMVGDTYSFPTEPQYGPPMKVIVSISKQFPELTFHVDYSNFAYPDDRQADVGTVVLRNGSVISEKVEKQARCVLLLLYRMAGIELN